MSLKTGKGRGSIDRPRIPLVRWSIAGRLALVHVGALSLSFCCAAVFFYLYQSKQALLAGNAALAREVTAVTAMLGDGSSPHTGPEGSRRFFRVVGRDGATIFETPSITREIPASVFPPASPAPSGAEWRTPRGEAYLLCSVPLPADTRPARAALLQVAVNIDAEKESTRDLQMIAVLFLSWGFIFAVVTTYAVTRGCVKPLETITVSAREITRHRLDKRIDGSRVPQEMVPVVASLNDMLDRLEESFAGLSHYTANLAHELRTPINNLVVEAGIALSRPRSVSEYRKVISSSIDEYERLTSIIDRLLFLARADSSLNELVVEPMDGLREVEEVADFYADTAKEAGIAIVCYGNGMLTADETLFRRAIGNLVSNAIKHTEPGGKVEITVHQEHDLSVKVSVADTGCGIPEEHLPKIFDRFYRVGSATRTEGYGLGLAIVKAIMSMHHGSVEVQSAPGIGTAVILTFPNTDLLVPSADSSSPAAC